MRQHLFDLLVDLARLRKTASYRPVARRIGLRSHELEQLFPLLGEISEAEVKAGRPMLSAVVVNARTKLPGKGFFSLARRLRRQQGLSNGDFFASEISAVYQQWGSNTRRYWLEQYWPSSTRDLENLHMWFHDKSLKKDRKVNIGDRVVFYEVEKHPDSKILGAKTLFASGTVLPGREYIPEQEQLRGGKRWIYKRRVETELAVPPTSGVPLTEVKRILGFKGWPQTGFELEKEDFERLESLLLSRQEAYNSSDVPRPFKPQQSNEEKPYNPQTPVQITPNDAVSDPAERAARLEKSNNAHRTLLNKLAEALNKAGAKVSMNRQVDLFAVIKGVNWIFEIKSVHEQNFLAQVRQGIAQLYEYRYKFRLDRTDTRLCLVLQTKPPQGLEWIIDYLVSDRKIHVCWSITTGFHVEGDGTLRLLTDHVAVPELRVNG